MQIKTLYTDTKSTWIDLNSDNAREVTKLFEDYHISSEHLSYALDKNERAHVEYDSTTKTFFLVYNVPTQGKVDNLYRSRPMTFIIKDNTLITVSNNSTKFIVNKMNRYLENQEKVTLYEFLFISLFIVSESFFPQVEYMQIATSEVNMKLREKASRTNLLALSDLEIGSVYLVSAAKQNVVLLEQIRASIIYRQFIDDEREQFEDALIEARQLVEMTQLNAQILQQLSSTYNNVLNNNLNDTMKLMTIISLLMTIPTIVTGFFGMNVALPFEREPLGWIIITLLMAVISVLAAVFINKKFK